ncbi:MAG: hypothetical protein ACPGPE_06265 [Planctomycetota bacterium]
MARARIIVLSSPRLARLDGLLVASGASPGRVERVDDAMELFEVNAAVGAFLVADLKDVPLADAGLLRRWQEGAPGSRILWVGGSEASEASFDDAGIRGTRLPWPIDMEALGELAQGTLPRSARTDVERSLKIGTAAPERAEAADDPPPGPGANGSPEAQHPPELDEGRDLELCEIESILGHGPSGDLAGSPPLAAAAHAGEDTVDRHPPQPRTAFLRAPISQVERPIPVPESTLRGQAPQGDDLTEEAQGQSAAPIEARAVDAHSLDGPLLTDEEIDAFFGESEDFVIPAMEPAGRDAQTEGPDSSSLDTAAAAPPLEFADAEGPPEDGSPMPSALAAPGSTDLTEANAAAKDARRPAWLKDQISDLADIVQALDLTARSTHAHLGLERELGQLRQFTRTIGYVAAPPPRGEQIFDLGVLLEEQLGALAGQTPDAPRILFRSRVDGATIEADKLLVTMALEALLLTAVGCAGPGDVIRVSIDAADGGPPCVHIRFPAGPMADLSPADAIQPYALKARLPDIGANALAAAGAIAVGQGGDLVLRDEEGGHRVFDVSFSGAPRP